MIADMASVARRPTWFGWSAHELIEALGAWFIYAVPPFVLLVLFSALDRIVTLRPYVKAVVRFAVLAVAVSAIRVWLLDSMGADPWRPWFVVDAGFLSLAFCLTHLGNRTCLFPAFVVLLSVSGFALMMDAVTGIELGGYDDPVTWTRKLNRVVLLIAWICAAVALWLDRGASIPLRRVVQPTLVFMVLPAAVLVVGVSILQAMNRPAPAIPGRDSAPPNLVIITADALRADYCSVYGGDAATPSLERLAAAGVRFDRYYTLAPWTLPSLYGLFSSKYPPALTPAEPGEAVPLWKKQASAYALIEDYWSATGKSVLGELDDRGYNTSAIVGNPLFNKDDWLFRSVDEVRLTTFSASRLRGPFRATPALQALVARWQPGAFERRPVDMTRAATEYAEEFIRYTQKQPFALWVHYFDPHGPYDPPPEYRDSEGPWKRFPPAEYHGMDFLDQWNWIAEMPDAHRAYVQSLYEGEIGYMDSGVGRILDAIDQNGLADNTYVVFSSDHGEEFWDHGKWEHGHSLFEDQIRVPLIVRGPGIPVAAIDRPVSAIDVLPTIREWLGLPRMADARGASMANALADGTPIAAAPVYAQATSFYSEPLQAVIDGDRKAIHGMHSGQWQLFDLNRDPGEHDNLASAAPDELARLKEMMDAWAQTFPVTFDQLQTGADQNRVDEFEEMLKSMGYLN